MVHSNLLRVARDELLAALGRAQHIIRLASPFIGRDVAREVVAQAHAGRASDRRLLTAVTQRSVSAGTLSPTALATFLDRGWDVKSIPNLHAKLYVVDRSWGIIGSGNLTGAGIGRAGPRAGNIELAALLDEAQRADASRMFDEWWLSLNAETVTVENLEPFMDLEARVTRSKAGLTLGREMLLPDSEDVHVVVQINLARAQLWWVNQGSTFEAERPAGYVFAPERGKRGQRVPHWEALMQLRRGDAVLHYVDGFVRSVSHVTEPFTRERRPIAQPGFDSARPGYPVRVAYLDASRPVALADIPLEWRLEPGGPFTHTGAVRQGYLFPLSEVFKERFFAAFAARWPALTLSDAADD